MLIALLFVALFGMLLLGFPVAVALAVSSALYVVAQGNVPDVIVLHRMVNGVDSFPLLAVPFFILAGNLMNTAGITNRIFDFAIALVGWLKGGLGHVNVAASVIFAGMSGTAVADAGGLGTIEMKAMRDRGYPAEFALGITAASSTIGPIIPPSLPLVIYGVMANASIGQLFVAGFVPGLIMAGSLMVYVAWYAHSRGIAADAAFRMSTLFFSFIRAFPALMTPGLIIGGILFGLFTPTEAAVAACAWALFLGFGLYRSMNWRRLLRVSMDTVETTAAVLFIVAAASIFAWVLTQARITEYLTLGLLSVSDNPIVILLLINLVLLAVGCFMETIAAITILVPVLLPVIIKLGIDPVHFGIMMVLNLMIGLLTPPVGMVLYVLARVSGMPLGQAIRATAPFLIPLVAVLLLIAFVPQVTLFLPQMIYR
jgi:tripartite ATP-independent transporter DctM subunit